MGHKTSEYQVAEKAFSNHILSTFLWQLSGAKLLLALQCKTGGHQTEYMKPYNVCFRFFCLCKYGSKVFFIFFLLILAMSFIACKIWTLDAFLFVRFSTIGLESAFNAMWIKSLSTWNFCIEHKANSWCLEVRNVISAAAATAREAFRIFDYISVLKRTKFLAMTCSK